MSLAAAATAQAQASTSNFVAEHLKSPDDLSKIVALRKKLLKEQATLDAKLKSGAKEQLEATREGLLKLQATKKDMAGIREAFAEIEALADGADSRGAKTKGAEAFAIITEVSQIHRNFVQTATMLQKLSALPGQVDELSVWLEHDQEDAMGPATYLLPLHFHLSKLEAFRNETVQTARRSAAADVQNQIADYFAPLDNLVKAFEEHLFALGRNIMDLAREGRTNVVVKVLKIVDKESKEDEKAAAIRLAKKANLEGASRFRSVVANARVIKLYRPKVLGGMERAAKELFEEAWNRFAAENPMGLLNNLDWIYKDLELVKEEIAPLFPEDYNIFRWYVKAYHKILGTMLKDRILATDPEASSLLTLYQFTKEYESTMKQELGVDVDWLKPSLLGGKEQEIIDDYLSLIIKKIDEWSANLMSDEVRAFVARENPPDEDTEGLYGMQGAVILFQMVNQQMDLAADSGQGSILTRAIDHACKAMANCQATWMRVLESEFKKQYEAKNPDEIVGGLVEYVIALANDQLKSADHAEALQNRMEPLVSQKYKVQIREAIDNAINGFLDVSKRCTQVLVELVFADLRPAVKELFQFPAWYAEGTTTLITETIRDYSQDYASHLNPNLFEVLQDDMIERFLLAYIGSLRKCSRLRMPGAADRMRQDTEDVMTLFTGYGREEEMKEKLEVLNQIIGLLTASSTMAFLSYWSFAKAHGPQLAFVEHIWRQRDDLERSDVAAIMESCKRKVAAEGLTEIPETGATIVHRAMQAYSASASTGGAIGAASSLFANVVTKVGGSMMDTATAAGGSGGWRGLLGGGGSSGSGASRIPPSA
ncbi:exocyst complex component Sec6 [Tilletiaria anomala UBC 951]|uniref:Exocyst complex component Sec6 n=1 Tax=Tilletiaria anomala (strain ATCC 24038 / CBS 436.72 / UBC 951) TaxID=1037660 RepID=A0A066VE46_TILAU|nr:exocyst complex component Sec6 [Tilletiaria anomala UBC 951]KDN40017.1 exocyst complex component Sec6 [Tilletiaria anomala UBC 951]